MSQNYNEIYDVLNDLNNINNINKKDKKYIDINDVCNNFILDLTCIEAKLLKYILKIYLKNNDTSIIQNGKLQKNILLDYLNKISADFNIISQDVKYMADTSNNKDLAKDIAKDRYESIANKYSLNTPIAKATAKSIPKKIVAYTTIAIGFIPATILSIIFRGAHGILFGDDNSDDGKIASKFFKSIKGSMTDWASSNINLDYIFNIIDLSVKNIITKLEKITLEEISVQKICVNGINVNGKIKHVKCTDKDYLKDGIKPADLNFLKTFLKYIDTYIDNLSNETNI